MIIYNGDKYACISCIRGHRSSTCKHTARMLVKVRTRGRPSPANIRDVIMVDITSRVKRKKLPSKKHCCDDIDQSNPHGYEYGDTVEENDHPPGHENCCKKMDAQPIIFIKAKQTQKAMVVDGKLKIIVKDPKTDGDEVKYISEKEFLKSVSAQTISNNTENTPPKLSISTSTHTNDNSGDVFDKRLQNCSVPQISRKKCCDPNHIIKSNVSFPIDNTVGRNKSIPTYSIAIDAVSPPTTVESVTSNDSPGNDIPLQTLNNSFSHLTSDDLESKKLSVDIFTHKGLYLSSECSCPANECDCINCLIHRNEEELNNYILQSGVPLTNILDSSKPGPYDVTACSGPDCECSLIDCTCQSCSVHPTDIIPFERFYYQGFNNITLRRKTIIKYKHKLIPSEYWWDFLTVELPSVNTETLETIDLKDYFEKLLKKYQHEFLNSKSEWGLLNDLEGFYVI